MDPVVWTYIYLKAVAFGMVCALLVSVPFIASMRPGEGVPGRYFLYGGVVVVAGYVGGLVLF